MTASLLLLRNADVYAPEALGRRHLLLGGGKVLWMGAHEPDLPAALGAEIIDLDAAQRLQLSEEIDTSCRALRMLFKPDKLNVAALGNMVPQLHVHVIARYRSDIAWPRPVWGAADARPHPPEELIERINALRKALGS